MRTVILAPEMEGFVESCVASGRYADADADAVIGLAMRLLRREEEKRDALFRSIEDAARGAEAGHLFELEEVMAELGAIIEAEETRQAARVES